ncbi:hypothetical protein M5C90_15990 [Pseudomonas chlororaphis subsp. piscium]|nr:hypothetical protein M5C90_15990 [Pseudomonas chlororaphis subsp. piscium]
MSLPITSTATLRPNCKAVSTFNGTDSNLMTPVIVSINDHVMWTETLSKTNLTARLSKNMHQGLFTLCEGAELELELGDNNTYRIKLTGKITEDGSTPTILKDETISTFTIK